jgi:putative serine protease PepD
MDEYQQPGQGLPPAQPSYGGPDARQQYGQQPYGQPDYPHSYQGQHEGSRRKDGNGVGAGKMVLVSAISAVIAALLVLLVMPAIFGVNPYDLVTGKVKKNQTASPVSSAAKVTNVVSTSEGAADVSTIAKKVTPSIVNVNVSSTSQGNMFFPSSAQEGTGSGVIYTADGYIITNNHVVEGAQSITVTLASGTELKAKVIGTDPENDIAVIKIDKTGLPPITIGNSDNLVVGQLVVAVGSPLGFEQTVTAGIISALHRNLAADSQTGQSTVLTDLIQTDAPINPGNSGGGLCDGGARLIGINAMIASQSGGSVGIGFAIPVNTAKRVANAIIAGKSVSHPYIGIQGQSVTSDVATQYNLPVTEGAMVTSVMPGTSAEKAGLKSGDIVVSVDGKPVKTIDDLIAAIRKKNVGDKISITYYSNGTKKTADLTIQEEPANLK